MKAKDLSILIPSRNEMFLSQTIKNILENIEADTEIIAVLDGQWADPVIPQHERVNVVYLPEAIGQRAATRLAAKLSNAKYIMKIDAHCAVDKGFDRKMIEGFEKMGDDCTMVPVMHNLWAFDWKCKKCGSRWYQGPTPTRCMKQERGVVPNEDCDNTTDFERKITWSREAKKHHSAYKNWKGRWSPANASYCFDSEPHFQYFKEYSKRPEIRKQKEETGFTETMGLQGSCFMMTRDKYWELDIDSKEFGSWGNQGLQIACDTWLSGGKVLCNHNTWYAHMFRTQGGDFSFPYNQSGRDVAKTKNKVRDHIWKGKRPKQKLPVSWLVEKFYPVPGWSDEDIEALKKFEDKKFQK